MMQFELKPGVRVCSIDSPSPRDIGTVIAVRGDKVKILWPRYISRWHDAEAVHPTGFSRPKGKVSQWLK